jgi:hypothetical protein
MDSVVGGGSAAVDAHLMTSGGARQKVFRRPAHAQGLRRLPLEGPPRGAQNVADNDSRGDTGDDMQITIKYCAQ